MSETEIFSRLTQLLNEGKEAVLCTLIEKKGSGPRDEGAKMLVKPDGKTFGTIGGGDMERKLVQEALEAMKEGRPRSLTFTMGLEPKRGAIAVDSICGGEVKIFLDVVKPHPRLIVIGSGNIAMPLAQLAHKTGFEILVVDDAKTATRERFPMASEILTGPFEEELEHLDVKPSDYVSIVYGETKYELAALRTMLKRKPIYIGLLGSRNKAAQHRRQLLAEGFSKEELEAICAPIGLDIRAQTPEEIAVSIVAELIKTRRDA